jgi:hypothetical protein
MEMMLTLTTGDRWDEAAMVPVGGPEPAPVEVSAEVRRSREYIGRFVERVPPLRAIRFKCGACMGGEPDRMPRGEVAQAIDECGSVGCPLWPFRFGSDPWRPEASEVQKANARALAARRLRHNDGVVANSP